MKQSLALLASLSAFGLAQAQNGVIVTGPGAGSIPEVRFFDPLTGTMTDSLLVFDPGFTGGVRVALGDVNGDTVADLIVGAGPGGLTLVRVFDGSDHSLITEFFPYDSRYAGGVNVAAGDVNGDGIDDIVTGPVESLAPIVKAFDGSSFTELYSITAYDATFEGGVNVACGDISGDGIDDVVTGKGFGQNALMRIWNGPNGTNIGSGLAFGSLVSAGVYVGCGDTDNDGVDEVISGPHGPVPSLTQVHEGLGLFSAHMFFGISNPNFGGGVRTASGDVDADGYDDLVLGAGPWSATVVGPLVNIYSGNGYALINSFFAYDPLLDNGVFVAGPWHPHCLADINNDGTLSPADFTAWIAAFNAMAPECDQNGDGLCTAADFNAWIANFNAGC